MKIIKDLVKIKKIMGVLILGMLVIGCETNPNQPVLDDDIIFGEIISFKNAGFALHPWDSHLGIAEMMISPQGVVNATFEYPRGTIAKRVQMNLDDSDKSELRNLFLNFSSFEDEYGDLEINGFAQFEIALVRISHSFPLLVHDIVSIGYTEAEELPESLSLLVSKLNGILIEMLVEF